MNPNLPDIRRKAHEAISRGRQAARSANYQARQAIGEGRQRIEQLRSDPELTHLRQRAIGAVAIAGSRALDVYMQGGEAALMGTRRRTAKSLAISLFLPVVGSIFNAIRFHKAGKAALRQEALAFGRQTFDTIRGRGSVADPEPTADGPSFDTEALTEWVDDADRPLYDETDEPDFSRPEY